MKSLQLSDFSWNLFFKSNRLFLTAIAFFVLVCTGLLVFLPKGYLVLWFSAHRHPVLDTFFGLMTKGGEVAGFLIVLFLLLFVGYRWVAALGLLTIGVSLCSNGSKSLFHQPRPARYFQDLGMDTVLQPVTGIPLHSGFTSLPSGHTMAAFAFFSLLAFSLTRKGWPALLCFLMAGLVGLSRIYLGQHFEADVLLGALMGTILAAVFYRLFYPGAHSNRWGAGKWHWN